MRKFDARKWLWMMSSGAAMFQVPGCTETALGLTSFFSALTAGGVLYLIFRVLRD